MVSQELEHHLPGKVLGHKAQDIGATVPALFSSLGVMDCGNFVQPPHYPCLFQVGQV